jgi:hypothetical protein
LAAAACSSGYTLETPDAGTDAAAPTTTPDAAPAGPVSTPGKMTCGTQLCDLTAQQCCINSTTDFQCQDKTKACANSSGVCDEKADCTDAKVCCGAFNFNGKSTTDCEATCDGINQSQACLTDAECGAQKCVNQSCFGIAAWLCGLNAFCQKL